jgi:hypothetical protein
LRHWCLATIRNKVESQRIKYTSFAVAVEYGSAMAGRVPGPKKTGHRFQDRALDFSVLRAEREIIRADLVFPEGTLEPARGARLTCRADHVDEGAQRARYLAAPGIVKEESLESRRPTLEHADELT